MEQFQRRPSVEISDEKRAIAVGIAVEAHSLGLCTVHNQLFASAGMPAASYELARTLMAEASPRVMFFKRDLHALKDLIRRVIAEQPTACPCCEAATIGGRFTATGRHEIPAVATTSG